MNAQKYLTELSRLLGFMSSWDREAVLEQYKREFDGTRTDEEVIEAIGTPTKVAIEIARDYVPTPRPGAGEGDVLTLSDEAEEETPALPEETGPVFDGADELPEEVRRAVARRADVLFEPEEGGEEEEPPAPAGQKRQVRPAVLIVFILVSLAVGLPVTLLLIAVGAPFMALGAGMAGGAVYACMRLIARLSMVSDMLLVGGAGLMLIGLGVVVFWLGLWISITLARAWIGGVVVRLGNKLCWRREEEG